jgi:hypothetical protein
MVATGKRLLIPRLEVRRDVQVLSDFNNLDPSTIGNVVNLASKMSGLQWATSSIARAYLELNPNPNPSPSPDPDPNPGPISARPEERVPDIEFEDGGEPQTFRVRLGDGGAKDVTRLYRFSRVSDTGYQSSIRYADIPTDYALPKFSGDGDTRQVLFNLAESASACAIDSDRTLDYRPFDVRRSCEAGETFETFRGDKAVPGYIGALQELTRTFMELFVKKQ